MSIALSTVAAFAAAVAGARSVDLTSYTLRDGLVRRALVAAAGAGTAVRVRLERDPLDDAAGTLHAANAASIAALEAAGADAAATAPGAPVLHLKGALVDGVAWLDDRNWAGDRSETLIRDSDPDDVAAVRAALEGRPGTDPHLRTTKAGAQGLELAVVRTAAAAPLALESESFGSGGVYNALLARARAHTGPTRLLVAGREALGSGVNGETERRRLGHLAGLGVEVRTGDPARGDLDEKLAAGANAAWIGSANATYARGSAGDQQDWGLFTRSRPVVDGLRAAFEANWNAALPWRP